MVRWQQSTNQIFCCTSNGLVRVLFDPTMSKKGVLLSSSRAPRRENDPTDVVGASADGVMGEIHNPHALPMFRKDSNNVREQGKKRSLELKDPLLAKIPQRKGTQGPGTKENVSFFFTQHVMANKNASKTSDHLSRHQDPRAALLAMDELSKSDPIFFGKAYAESQPEKRDPRYETLHTQTAEEEQEEFKKRQKKL
jgi:hypothetical protein